MNIKKTAKKIVAVSSGVALAGATFMGALGAAPDLSSYPEPFVKDGQFDGKIVVGEHAASQDILGAIDIAASLQQSDSGETESTALDSGKFGDSSDVLELNEPIGKVQDSFTVSDLSSLLRDGQVKTTKGTSEYKQVLTIDSAEKIKVEYTENEEDIAGYYLTVPEDEELFTLSVEFSSALESSVDDGELKDIEGESLELLGKEYTIVQAKLINSDQGVELQLIEGDASDVLEEGATKTYTVNGKEYEVTPFIVGEKDGDSVTKFLINGEITDIISEGDTEKLSDGLKIGVREIILSERNFEGDQGSLVEFYLGAESLTLTDDDFSDDSSDGSVELADEDLEDASVEISGELDGDFKIREITYKLSADPVDGDSKMYVSAEEGIKQYLDEPQGFIGDWDIVFDGLTDVDKETISFKSSGDDKYELSFTNTRGQEYTVDYAEADGTDTYFGTEDDKLVFYEKDVNQNGFNEAGDFWISEDDTIIITDSDSLRDLSSELGQGFEKVAEDDAVTSVISFSDVDDDDKVVSFDVDGEEVTATYTGDVTNITDPASGTLRLSGDEFAFYLYEDGTDYKLAMDINNDGQIIDGTYADIVTEHGAVIQVSDSIDPASGWKSTIITSADELDTEAYQAVSVEFTSDDEELDLSVSGLAGTLVEQDIDDSDDVVYVDSYGTEYLTSEEDDEADELEISYPSEQVTATVRVQEDSAQVESSSKIQSVGLAVLDSEVSVDQDNLIVVGGPCANTIAADLLGNPSDCTEGFQEGVGMIRTFDTGDNVAILVAGYSARDTVESSRVLAARASELSGDSAEIIIAGQNDISIQTAE